MRHVRIAVLWAENWTMVIGIKSRIHPVCVSLCFGCCTTRYSLILSAAWLAVGWDWNVGSSSLYSSHYTDCIILGPVVLLWKVKKSRNRPIVAQRVPGGLGSQISWHSAHEGGEVVSLTHRPPLPPGVFLVLIFTRGWVDARAMVWSEGNMSLKNLVTTPGIDPGTVRLVAQRLNPRLSPIVPAQNDIWMNV